MDLICPVTGLRVFSRPEWIGQRVSDSFTANHYIIGNAIICSLPSGKADLEGVQNAMALNDEVAQYVSEGTGPYIQIEDYASLKGSTQAARSYFTKKTNEKNRLLSMIFCNLSPAVSIGVKIGKRFITNGKHIHIARDYGQAIEQALELCDQHQLKQDVLSPGQGICFDSAHRSLSPLEIMSDNAWNFQTPGCSNRSVIIDRCIIHFTLKGNLEAEHLPFVFQTLDLCQAALPEGSAVKYIVVDSSDLKGASRAARVQYMQAIKNWHRRFPFRIYIFYGVNAFTRAAVHLARPFMPFKVEIAKNFNHALSIIRQDKLGDPTRQPQRQAKSPFSDPNHENIEKLLAFIGGIDWTQEGVDNIPNMDEQHPFYILFQSVKLIKEELDALFAERKKTEISLQNSNSQLQTALSELKQAQEKMVRQERLAAVGQLSAGIAHDFNNILAGILGFAELIQISPDIPAGMKSDIQQIIGLGQRAAYLVNQLSDFSGKTIRNPEKLDLALLVRESVKFFKRTVPENIQIHLDVDPGDYLVEADSTQIQQAIINLAVNAKDAMPSGGELRIGLSVVECADNIHCVICHQPLVGKWVRLKVSDTGTGISADILPRIFEPFFTTKKVGAGSGLGLSQVSGIVEQHRGHIRMEGQAGQGTTFILYFPIVLASGNGNTPELKPAPIKKGQGEIILVVEDEPVVLETTTAMLECLGYRILKASNGEKALAVFEEHRTQITLVLSDMMMPDMNGETLFHRLRDKAPLLKMVMMSGYPLEKSGATLLEQGVVDWFQKPASLEQLSRIVGKALSQGKGRWD